MFDKVRCLFQNKAKKQKSFEQHAEEAISLANYVKKSKKKETED